VTEDLVLKHFHHTKDIATRDPKYALATQMNHFLNTLTTYHGKKNGDAPQVFQALSDATRSPNIIHQALGQVFLRFSGQSVNKSLETLMKDTSYFVSALFFPFVDMLYPDFPDDSAWLSKLKILLNDGHGNEAKRVIKPINKLHNNITFKAKALTLIFRHPRSFFEARTQILTSLMKIAGIQDASIDEQLKLGIKKAFKHFTDGQSVSGYENGLTADGSLLNFSEPLVLWHMLGYGIEQGYSYCALHDELYR
jgi:hypothetical protein